MTDEPRILTGAETAQRRAEQAASAPGAAIDICAYAGCGDRARYGPFCGYHRLEPETIGVAHQLTEDDYDRIRAAVESKAAPLFLVAMNWLASQQLGRMGIELPAFEDREQPATAVGDEQ